MKADTSMQRLNRYRLRLPGPTPVPERVRQATAENVLNHRGPEFRKILAETESLAKDLFGTTNDILFFASSGTGMMEASLANILAPGDRVLVTLNGQWGERFAAIAQAYHAQVDSLEVPWGEAPDPAQIGAKLDERDYKAVLITHNESSTGVVANIAAIGSQLRERPTLLIVDAVSSLGCIEMQQDAWGADIVLSASQKGLMCPPGIGLASISPKAWEVVNEERQTPRFYWDFRRAKASFDKVETPFTPPVSLMRGLQEALHMIHEEGLSNVLSRHQRLATALRAGCQALGLPSFPSDDVASHSVTALVMPEDMDGKALVRHLHEHYGTVIAGSRNRLAGRVVRIGTMGNVSETDILSDLHYLEASLSDLGKSPPAGAGVKAASAVLREQKEE